MSTLMFKFIRGESVDGFARVDCVNLCKTTYIRWAHVTASKNIVAINALNASFRCGRTYRERSCVMKLENGI